MGLVSAERSGPARPPFLKKRSTSRQTVENTGSIPEGEERPALEEA